MLSFLRNSFKPVSLKTASLILAMASVLSYLAGLLRDILITYYFGATQLSDIFYSSFMIPDLIFSITTAGALSGVFLPMFRSLYIDNKDDAAEFAGAFFLWAMILVSLVCTIAYFFMPELVDLTFGKADYSSRVEIIKYSRIMLLSPVMFTLSNFLGSTLMTFKHYLSFSLSAFFYNLGIIFMTVVFHENMGVLAPVLGVVLGLVLHASVRGFDILFTNFRIKFVWFHKSLKKLVNLSFLKTASMMSLVLSMLVFSSQAYGMAEGAVTSFNLARNLQSFVVSLFGISLATAAFPFIVDQNKNAKFDDLKLTLDRVGMKILVWSLPSMVGMYLVSNEMISLFFQRGEFTQSDTLMTVAVLSVFLISIPFESLNHLLARIYYANLNMIFPAIASMLFLAINLLGAFYVAETGIVSNLALVFVCASFIQFLFLLFFLERKFHFIDFSFLFNMFKVFISVLVMYFCVRQVGFYFDDAFLSLIFKVVVGVLVYPLMLLFFKIFHYTGINIRM